MKHDHKWIAGAAKVLAGGADRTTDTTGVAPLHDIQQAADGAKPTTIAPAEPLSSGPRCCRIPIMARTEEP